MTDRYELTRRKALAALGTVGVGSVGAGFGTGAFFGDEESFDGNALVAGELDMMVDWEVHYADASAEENDDWVAAGLLSGDPDERDTDVDGDGTDDFRVLQTAGDPDAVPDGYVGVPTVDDPLVAVPDAGVDDYLTQTATGAFPDENDDEAQDLVLTREQIASLTTGLTAAEIEARYREQFAQLPRDLPTPLIELDDVKPGDFGEATFSLHLFDTPGYVWLTGGLDAAAEGPDSEAETKDPDEEAGVVELLDAVRVVAWHDDGDNVLESSEVVRSPHDVDAETNVTLTQAAATVFDGSLREFLAALGAGSGIPLDADPTTPGRDCYPNSVTRHVAVAWWLPVDHANEVQTDTARFSLGYYVEQCQANDGDGMAPESGTDSE